MGDEWKWLTDINPHAIAFVKRASVRDPERPTEPQRLLFWKAEDISHTGGSTTVADKDQLKGAVSMLLEAGNDDLSAEQREQLAKKFTKAEEPPVGDFRLGFTKAEWDQLPPARQAHLEQIERERQEDRKRIEKAEKEAEASRVTFRKAELDKLVGDDFAHLPYGSAFLKAEKPGDPTERQQLVDVLYDLEAKAGPQVAGKVTQILKAASESVGGLMRRGPQGGAGPVGGLNRGSTWERIRAASKPFQKAEVNGRTVELSEPQAIDAFLKTEDGQALYRDYMAEQRQTQPAAAAGAASS